MSALHRPTAPAAPTSTPGPELVDAYLWLRAVLGVGKLPRGR